MDSRKKGEILEAHREREANEALGKLAVRLVPGKGMEYVDVADMPGCGEDWADTRAARHAEGGLPALRDLPRPGRPALALCLGLFTIMWGGHTAHVSPALLRDAIRRETGAGNTDPKCRDPGAAQGGGFLGGLSRGRAPSSPHASSRMITLRDNIGIRRPSQAALLPRCAMARALCATGDATRQKILASPSRPGVRLRACRAQPRRWPPAPPFAMRFAPPSAARRDPLTDPSSPDRARGPALGKYGRRGSTGAWNPRKF